MRSNVLDVSFQPLRPFKARTKRVLATGRLVRNLSGTGDPLLGAKSTCRPQLFSQSLHCGAPRRHRKFGLESLCYVVEI